MPIHERAIRWTDGYVPETLAATVDEHHPAAVTWHVLPRAGRAGYKRAGLEVQVTGEHASEEVAAAILNLAAKHHGETGCALYRIDGHDENGVRLNDNGLPLRMSEDGADDVADTGTAALIRAAALSEKLANLMFEKLDKALARLDGMASHVSDCLDAMTGAVAEVTELRMRMAEDEIESSKEDHKHERNMKLLDFLMQRAGAGGATGPGEKPLANVIASMPESVEQVMAGALGQKWDDLKTIAALDDADARRDALMAMTAGFTPGEKDALGKVPMEWQERFKNAMRQEFGAGFSGAA